MDMISRREAHERGLKRFFTGVACMRGHAAERYTSNGACTACLNFTTPKKNAASNFAFLPARALGFGTAKGNVPTAIEAQAVFRYIEAAGWHLAALEALRADPALMAKYDHEPTVAERFI